MDDIFDHRYDTNEMRVFRAELSLRLGKHNRDEGCEMAHSLQAETRNGIPGFCYLYDKGVCTWVAPIEGGILAQYDLDRRFVAERDLEHHMEKLKAELEEYGA